MCDDFQFSNKKDNLLDQLQETDKTFQFIKEQNGKRIENIIIYPPAFHQVVKSPPIINFF